MSTEALLATIHDDLKRQNRLIYGFYDLIMHHLSVLQEEIARRPERTDFDMDNESVYNERIFCHRVDACLCEDALLASCDSAAAKVFANYNDDDLNKDFVR